MLCLTVHTYYAAILDFRKFSKCVGGCKVVVTNVSDEFGVGNDIYSYMYIFVTAIIAFKDVS